MRTFFLVTSLFVLTGCASLQPRIDKVSINSYERGCALRGMQRGMSEADALSVCGCHTQKAIALTSQEDFLTTSELIAKADEAQRETAEFKDAVKLMRSTFNTCKQELGIR